MDDYTRKFNAAEDKDQQVHYILTTVYESLKEKGYDPINQIVGYILSEDPTYIPNHIGTSCCRCWSRAIWSCKTTGKMPRAQAARHFFRVFSRFRRSFPNFSCLCALTAGVRCVTIWLQRLQRRYTHGRSEKGRRPCL